MTTTLSWPSILQALQQSIPSDKIKTWVAPLQCHGLDAGVLHLSAPNAFFVQWIHKNYEPLILQVLRNQHLECHTLKMSIHTIPTENIAIKNILPPVVATPAIAQANEFQTQLNPNFTFDSYIVGPHNRMAKALCEQLLGNNQTVYNPLMIHGSVGVGKTHLLQSLAHAALQQQPHKRVIYTTSEMFTNHFITALGKKQIDRFRAYYRSADILLIDDVQFFTNKKSTTQEFFHTFNELQAQGKSIVLTSDRKPEDIADVHQGLISRFQGGLTVAIQGITENTKLDIIRHKAQRESLNIPVLFSQKMASLCDSNVRSIEGMLKKIKAHCQLQPKTTPFSETMWDNFLSSLQQPVPQNLIQNIAEAVSAYFHISVEHIFSTQKTRNYTNPRYIAIYLSYQKTGKSIQELSVAFGKRTPASILTAIAKAREAAITDIAFRTHLQAIEAKLK